MPKWPLKAPLGSVPALMDYPPRFHEGPSVRERKERRKRRRVSQEVSDILNMRKGKSLRALMDMKVE